MILNNYIWTAPSFLTNSEVEIIHQHANKIDFKEAEIGLGHSDPDADGGFRGDLDDSIRKKIALFCNVEKECVIESIDAKTIYEVPLLLLKEKLDTVVCEKLKIKIKIPLINSNLLIIYRLHINSVTELLHCLLNANPANVTCKSRL